MYKYITPLLTVINIINSKEFSEKTTAGLNNIVPGVKVTSMGKAHKYHNSLFLITCVLLILHYSSISLAENIPTKTVSCQAFDNMTSKYNKSLSKDDSGKPMASEQSVQLAWMLIGSAEDCLIERSVSFKRISTYALKILPENNSEPSKTASLLEGITNGSVIYDVGFFLRKPFAAGGFEQNILFLPHSAILGKVDMVTRHELTHARAHSLVLTDDWRIRHLWIFGKDSMYVDEVIAYAEGGINIANSKQLKFWSLGMAEKYIAEARKLIKAENAEVATAMDGQRCPMSQALKSEVYTMLNCIESFLHTENSTPAEISSCDRPRNETTFCAH